MAAMIITTVEYFRTKKKKTLIKAKMSEMKVESQFKAKYSRNKKAEFDWMKMGMVERETDCFHTRDDKFSQVIMLTLYNKINFLRSMAKWEEREKGFCTFTSVCSYLAR